MQVVSMLQKASKFNRWRHLCEVNVAPTRAHHSLHFAEAIAKTKILIYEGNSALTQIAYSKLNK
jgi:hypothetical protein